MFMGSVHRNGHEDPDREQRYSSTFSSTLALDLCGWPKPRPSSFTTGKGTRHSLYGRLCGPQGRSGRV